MILVSALLAAVSTSPLWADDGEKQPKGSPSFAVPESPAFTFLGASPAAIAQPGTARDLAAQLVNAFDEQGHVRQGFALELRPASLNPIDLGTYQRYWPRLLYNAQLSLGTVQSAGDTGSTDIAAGLRLTLVDRSDPMLHQDYRDKLRGVINACKPDQPDEPEDAQLACMSERMKAVREAWVEDHWNDFKLSAAIALGWRAPGSILKDTDSRGWSAWGAASVPLGRRGQVVGQLRYNHVPEAQVTADNPNNALSFGARGFFGSGRMNAFLEVTGTKRYGVSADAADRTNSWSGGLEFRITEHTWISTGFGNSFGNESEDNRIRVLANLRFALSDESRIKLTGQ